MSSAERAGFRRRTHVIVAKEFQWRFAVAFAFVGGFIAIIVGIIIFFVMQKSIVVFIESNAITSPEAISFIQGRWRQLFATLTITYFATTAVLLLLGIYGSHKIAGPIYALMRQMRSLAGGDYTATLALRKRDQFHYLQDAYNELVAALQNQVQDDLLGLDNIITLLTHKIEQLRSENKISVEDMLNFTDIVSALRAHYNRKSRSLFKGEEEITIEEVVL